jgi:hypothetical protein
MAAEMRIRNHRMGYEHSLCVDYGSDITKSAFLDSLPNFYHPMYDFWLGGMD